MITAPTPTLPATNATNAPNTPRTAAMRTKHYYADIKFHDVRKCLSTHGYRLVRGNPKQHLHTLSVLWRNYRNIPFREIEQLKEQLRLEQSPTSSSPPPPSFELPILNHLEHSYLLTRKAELATRMAALVHSTDDTWLSKRVPTTHVIHASRNNAQSSVPQEYIPDATDLAEMERMFLHAAAQCLCSRAASAATTGAVTPTTSASTSTAIVLANKVTGGKASSLTWASFRALCLRSSIEELLPMSPANAPSDGNDNVWILKPSTLSRGRGITMVSTLEELLVHVQVLCGGRSEGGGGGGAGSAGSSVGQNSTTPGKKPEKKPGKPTMTLVVQQYLDQPLLLPMSTKNHHLRATEAEEEAEEKETKKTEATEPTETTETKQQTPETPRCKFDIRCWVTVSKCRDTSGAWSIQVFKHPYLRLCGTAYTPTATRSKALLYNPLIHLTNNSVQSKDNTIANQNDLM